MKAIWNGQVLAESERILEADGYKYFPRGTVKMNLLRKAPRTGSDLECPHGVQFYDVTADGAKSERAAWSYEAPKPAMSHVDHWVAFWEDVRLE
ncbi:MAG: DUF427 domain-containing protein [Aestuariivirga sp.]